MSLLRITIIVAFAGTLTAGCTKAQFTPNPKNQKTVGDLVTQLESDGGTSDPKQTDGGGDGTNGNNGLDGGGVTVLTPENVTQFVDPTQIVPCDTTDVKIISIEAINMYLQNACDLEDRLKDLIGDCSSNGCDGCDDKSSDDDSSDDDSSDDDEVATCSNCQKGTTQVATSSHNKTPVLTDIDMSMGSVCIQVCDHKCAGGDSTSDDNSSDDDSADDDDK